MKIIPCNNMREQLLNTEHYQLLWAFIGPLTTVGNLLMRFQIWKSTINYLNHFCLGGGESKIQLTFLWRQRLFSPKVHMNEETLQSVIEPFSHRHGGVCLNNPWGYI